MSKELESLHILTAKAVVVQQKYLAGIIDFEEFKEEIKKLDCHCHKDIVLEKKHEELDCCYREQLDGILKMCDTEGKK